MSADILKLSDYRINDVAGSEIDLATAVDAAIRDLREILACWGSGRGTGARTGVRADAAHGLYGFFLL